MSEKQYVDPVFLIFPKKIHDIAFGSAQKFRTSSTALLPLKDRQNSHTIFLLTHSSRSPLLIKVPSKYYKVILQFFEIFFNLFQNLSNILKIYFKKFFQFPHCNLFSPFSTHSAPKIRRVALAPIWPSFEHKTQ